MGVARRMKTIARRLGLESMLRPRGRPRVRPVQKTPENESYPFSLPAVDALSIGVFHDLASHCRSKT